MNLLQRLLEQKDDGEFSVNHLATAFKEAIDEHTKHPHGTTERRLSSKKARDTITRFLGINETTGQPKPLLGANQKLQKTKRGPSGDYSDAVLLPDGSGIETTGLTLSPAYRHGKKFNTCPNSLSCKEACLGKTSGGYFQYGGGADLEAMKGPRLVGLKKTQAMINEPKAFAIRLHDEISAAKFTAELSGDMLGVRLNVLSDIHPKVWKPIIDAHPDVSFYDYTKNMNAKPVAPNHHLVYSSSGVSQTVNGKHIENPHQNWTAARKKLDEGHNVAMAFSVKGYLPKHVRDLETGKTYHVISGDDHDFRPLDGKHESGDGYIVGLSRKSINMKDNNAAEKSNGFFVHYDPQFMVDGNKKVKDENGKYIPTNHLVTIEPQKKRTFVLNNDMEKEKL